MKSETKSDLHKMIKLLSFFLPRRFFLVSAFLILHGIALAFATFKLIQFYEMSIKMLKLFNAHFYKLMSGLHLERRKRQ